MICFRKLFKRPFKDKERRGVVAKTQKKMFHCSSLEKATKDDFATSK